MRNEWLEKVARLLVGYSIGAGEGAPVVVSGLDGEGERGLIEARGAGTCFSCRPTTRQT